LIDAPKALVNLEADLVDLFPVDHHWLDALGDHGLRDILAANARGFYFFPAADPDVVRQFSWNFDEGFRNELDIHGIVFCPVVVMLGHTIGGADNRVTVLGRGVFFVGGFEPFAHRIVGLLRMQRVVNRALDRFVKFGEWSVVKSSEWSKD